MKPHDLNVCDKLIYVSSIKININNALNPLQILVVQSLAPKQHPGDTECFHCFVKYLKAVPSCSNLSVCPTLFSYSLALSAAGI